MLKRMRPLDLSLCVMLTVVLTSCGEANRSTVPQQSPFRSQAAAPSGPQAAAGETTPCPAEAQEHTIPLLADADGPPSGVGGEDEGEIDEGRAPPVPDDPDAVVLDIPTVPEPGSGAPPGVQASPDDILFFHHLEQRLISRATAAEPNVASDGSKALLTWNWYAAASSDGGRTFRGMDPDDFPTVTGFCCDQLTHYIPERNLWIWVMQSRKNANGNVIRVAVARGDQPFTGSIDFTYWDWTPQHGGFFSEGTWLDRPKIGNSEEHLFIAVNAYTQGEDPRGALVVRMPLDQLEAGEAVGARCMGTDAQPVPVTVARDSMYLADHVTTSELILWRWPDSADVATPFRILDRDATGQLVKYVSRGFSCPRAGIAETDWCEEWSDARIQTGWIANGQIGFAWNAAQDGNSATPYPYVYALFIDESTMTVVDHWYIKSTEVAAQYPAFAPNARGDLGGLVLFGAGEGPEPDRPRQGFASCAAVVRDSASGEWDWVTQETLRSENDPPLYRDASRPRVGDYLGAWANGGNENTWSGGCMTYGADGTQVHFLQFGLRRDNPNP
jgi:hypothetical protein